MKLGYRTDEEIARWRERDPLLVDRIEARRRGEGAHRRRGRGVARRRRRVRPRERQARPVGCPRTRVRERDSPAGRCRPVTRCATSRRCRRRCGTRWSATRRSFVVGEDVRESLRGVTKAWPQTSTDRVLDMPISEQMFTGFATGAALAGHRAVVEFQIPALLYIAFEQIVNQAQKLRLMTGGQASVPVVYVVPGSGARLGPRRPAFRSPVLAVRSRRRQDGSSGHRVGRLRAARLVDSRRRPRDLLRTGGNAAAARRAARGAVRHPSRQRPDPPRGK